MGKEYKQLHSDEVCDIFSLNTTEYGEAMSQKLEQKTQVQVHLLPDFQCGFHSPLNCCVISFLLNENRMALHQSVSWGEDKYYKTGGKQIQIWGSIKNPEHNCMLWIWPETMWSCFVNKKMFLLMCLSIHRSVNIAQAVWTAIPG